MTDTITPQSFAFDVPGDMREMVRKTDPETSFEAAASVNKERDLELVRRILRANPAGLTDFELAEKATEITGIERLQTSLGKRRHDLGDEVEWTGERRPTRSGASARVWRAVISTSLGEVPCVG